MKKLNIVMALCVVGTLAGTAASAGYKYVSSLTVDPVNRSVKGSLADVRATADNLSYLGCRISTSSGNAVTVYCSAEDANGVKGGCSSTAQNFVQLASMLQSDSILSFTWDANNLCTSLTVENWSSNAPKQP